MSEEPSKAVIIDTGSGFCKAGLASDESPSCCITTRFRLDKSSSGHQGYLVGDQVASSGNDHQSLRSVERGVIKDWHAVEHIWQHCYIDLMKLDSTEHPVLCSFYPDENKTEKETTVMTFFETFSVPGYFCLPGSVLNLYGSGKTSGLVIDSGEDITSVVPVIDGYHLPYGHVMQETGGRDVSQYLKSLLGIKSLDDDTLVKIKEQRGYALLRAEDTPTFAPMVYSLPDGTKIQVTDEAVRAVDAIFKGSSFGSNDIGLAQMVAECLHKLDAENRRELASHLVLAGGNTMFKNMAAR